MSRGTLLTGIGLAVCLAALLWAAASAGYRFGRRVEEERWLLQVNYVVRAEPREVHAVGWAYIVLDRSAYHAVLQGKKPLV